MLARGKVVKFKSCPVVQTKDNETQNNETLKETGGDVKETGYVSKETGNVSKETEEKVKETVQEMETSYSSAPELLLKFVYSTQT